MFNFYTLLIFAFIAKLLHKCKDKIKTERYMQVSKKSIIIHVYKRSKDMILLHKCKDKIKTKS